MEKKHIQGHPKRVADDFRVHLRTIFRWVKKGWLKSENGRIITNYTETILPEWNNGFSFQEARRILCVSPGTMTNWRRKGLFKTILEKKISRDSIDRIKKQHKLGTFSLHPTHSLPQLIMDLTGMGHKELKKLLENGLIPSDQINNTRMIPNDYIDRERRAWLSTCRPTGARRILDKSRDSIRRRVKNGKLKTIFAFGQKRISLNRIAQTPEEKQRLKEYLRLEKKRYRLRIRRGKLNYRKEKEKREQLAQQEKKERQKKLRTKIKEQENNKKFLAKREEPNPKAEIGIPNYKPIPVRIKGLKNIGLTTIEEAVRATGKPKWEIDQLCARGRIRIKINEDKVYIFIHSLEAFIKKIKTQTAG